jgi:hypothetical protein
MRDALQTYAVQRAAASGEMMATSESDQHILGEALFIRSEYKVRVILLRSTGLSVVIPPKTPPVPQ